MVSASGFGELDDMTIARLSPRESRDPLAEKCTRQLPPLRVSESLETALLRLAAREDRRPSDYIRRVLELHVFGHAASLRATGEDV